MTRLNSISLASNDEGTSAQAGLNVCNSSHSEKTEQPTKKIIPNLFGKLHLYRYDSFNVSA